MPHALTPHRYPPRVIRPSNRRDKAGEGQRVELRINSAVVSQAVEVIAQAQGPSPPRSRTATEGGRVGSPRRRAQGTRVHEEESAGAAGSHGW